MSTPRIRIIDRFLWRLLGNPGNPAAPASPIHRRKTKVPLPREQAAKAPIKTHGIERNPRVYGSIPIGRGRISEVQAEALAEEAAHEKDLTAPILSFQGKGSSFGEQMGGIGLVDPSIIQGVQQWEAQQRSLLAGSSVDLILPNSRGGQAPIKTYRN